MKDIKKAGKELFNRIVSENNKKSKKKKKDHIMTKQKVILKNLSFKDHLLQNAPMLEHD